MKRRMTTTRRTMKIYNGNDNGDSGNGDDGEGR